jgi:hypothetical protein
MKSNKGIVIGTIAFVALVGIGTVGAVKYIKGKNAVADTGQTSPQDSSKAGAGLVANGTQAPPQDTTKLPDPIPATSVDTTAANSKWKDLPKPGAGPGVAGVVPGGGVVKPGVKPVGVGGKPVAGNTPPGNTPPTPPSALPPVPPVHTATTPPTPPGPPKGKVDESGF